MSGAPIGLDLVPLLGSRTGIARYVRGLWDALPVPVAGCAAAWNLGGQTEVREGPERTMRIRRFPGRAVETLWKAGFLPAETLYGGISLFHATGYLCPPRGRVPLVVSVHDLSPLLSPETMAPDQRLRMALWIGKAAARADRLAVPTAAVGRELAAAFPRTADRIRITRYALAPEWLASPRPIRAGRAHLDRAPTAVSVGEVALRKNLSVAMRAVAAARASDPRLAGLTYRIIGPDGFGARQVRDEAARNGWNAFVRFEGFLPAAEVVRAVDEAGAVLFPSLYEGLGYPPLQALARGVPVLASSIAPVVETVGDAAILLAANDARAWSEALRETLQQPRTARARASRGLRAASRYTADASAQDTLEVYEELLPAPAEPARARARGRSSMRVLLVSNVFPPDAVGGYEQSARSVAEILRAEGNDVRVLTSRPARPDVAASDPPWIRRELLLQSDLRTGARPSPLRRIGIARQDFAIVSRAVSDFRPDVHFLWNLGGFPRSVLAACDGERAAAAPAVYYLSDDWLLWQGWGKP